ncbi:TrmB family transcriptional regulator [Dethiosulfatarculus sandiegensis]|uniref:TrmB family transcriptional regulator n=1 Tax=Dethiosulfatarculus sandiegensis TaxID=1429043 RepID=A0A0D2JIP9_9BACT|nr:helix-turn-helix domain-containing protein [Dethiosulfatarculus sandiegensis]KIX15536.1 TrmB family transcriptional regulator [Dethiosulfatarculus sandiegensis]
MGVFESLKSLGFTKYEINCYLALLNDNPTNGSTLSRNCAVPRSKIYDVLRKMAGKGLVVEIQEGLFAPLPPRELLKRLKSGFQENIKTVEDHLANNTAKGAGYDYVWTIKGKDHILIKARQMIKSAQKELYIRLTPVEGEVLDPELEQAEQRGVALRYVSLGRPGKRFAIQVEHPESERLIKVLGGRIIDIIADRKEALVGNFPLSSHVDPLVNWTRNYWFVSTSRDSVRHDFYHYYLYKLYDCNEFLTPEEQAVYQLIKADD